MVKKVKNNPSDVDGCESPFDVVPNEADGFADEETITLSRQVVDGFMRSFFNFCGLKASHLKSEDETLASKEKLH